jgi:hypothetical protein
VLGSADHEPAPSGNVVGATEKVESWDLSEAVAKTAGENIQVRRFVRFNLGEGLQKKSVDFAAEVAELEADMKVE